ncbi:MAG TPA: hypothetical protein DCO79_06965 [Spirochaeta sp.]|nr:hypothetical protein [Spirochaeta sp.]
MNKSMRWAAAVFLLLSTVNIYSFDNMNRQIGIIYLKNAAAYYLNGQYTQAESFLEKTSEFHSSSSDYEYLYGLIRLEQENKINDAARYFEKAIENGNWILLDKKDCVTDLALILFRKKEYSKLIDIVEQEAFPDYRDNDLMYLYLLSLKYEGRQNKYRSLLGRSIERYSDDYRFAKLFVHESSGFRDGIIDNLPDYKSRQGALQVLLEAAMTLEAGGLRRSSIKDYLDAGGRDAAALIEYYRLRGGITVTELDKLLKDNFFENPSNRKKLQQILPGIDMRNRLDTAYSEYTGNIYYDVNDDGYFEELHLYENGRPVGISVDENQDGLIEVMIIFEGLYPAEVILSGDQFQRISYDIYPNVKELSIAEGAERDVYTFLRDRMTLNIYEIREADDKLIILKENVDNFLTDESALQENSVRISTYTGGGDKDNYGYLKQELERRDELYSVLKIYNRIIGNYVYQQFNDKRTNGFADIDYDNLIDLKETYSEGVIVSIEADDNKNGKYDYKITFDSEQTVSWWDFNEDGLYDCRQYLKNGVLINEYSSGFDGNFDIIERN